MTLAQTPAPHIVSVTASPHNDNALMDGLVSTLDPTVIRPGLARMQEALAALELPQNAVPVVHIAGTNGKGSVVAMLSSILHSAGYQVGATISPHLHTIRERIQLNGQPISVAQWLAARERLLPVVSAMADKPTYFEAIVLLAYSAFQQANVDIALVETGLGGRLDATNVVDTPILTAITSIGLDHTEVLGNTLAQIATEKAGIAKRDVPMVVGPNLDANALAAITAQTASKSAPVIHVSNTRLARHAVTLAGQQLYDTLTEQTFLLPLHGTHQADNLATVLTLIDALRERGWHIEDAAIQAGLQATRWPARCEVCPQQQFIIDGSHNPAGWQALTATLAELPTHASDWGVILTVKHGKSLAGLAELLNSLAVGRIWLPTVNNVYDYYSPEAIVAELTAAGVNPALFITGIDLATALQQCQAWQAEQPHRWGVLTGSLYTAGMVNLR